MNNTLIQYVETALWSSTGDDGSPLDANYTIDDIDSESLNEQEAQLNEFINEAGNLLDGLDLTNVAHDFWLTRNRHGAGFWDGDYPESIGDKLTDLAHKFGEVNLVENDGTLYFE